MKKTILVLLILLTFKGYSQLKEGQNFCSQNENGEYFPLSVNTKKILWQNTFYIETIIGKKEIKGKTYTEIKQEWENNHSDTIYLREEKGIVYEYEECCENETIRYNKEFKIGDKWSKVKNTAEFEIISLSGELKTPYCNYKNLLVVKAIIGQTTYEFYYLKGIGYVAATINKKLISCVTPEK
jgi:hypothetical protein